MQTHKMASCAYQSELNHVFATPHYSEGISFGKKIQENSGRPLWGREDDLCGVVKKQDVSRPPTSDIVAPWTESS